MRTAKFLYHSLRGKGYPLALPGRCLVCGKPGLFRFQGAGVSDRLWDKARDRACSACIVREGI